MRHAKIYGFALIAGTLGGIITMIFHPTGHDLLNQPDEVARRNELIAAAVHILAIASLPVVFFGLTGFCRRMDLENPLVAAGLVFYGFGELAVMSAAVLSGLAGPVLTRKILESDAATQKILNAVLMNNFQLNQGFTKVYAAAAAAAFMLWAIPLLKAGKLMRITAVIGLIVSLLSLAGIFSGHLKLDVHGFGLFTFAQSVWLILVAVFMIRPAGAESREIAN